MVAGMLIPESKVESRLKALALGRGLKALLVADQKKIDQQLRDEGYPEHEINCLRHSNRIRTMENMGLGISQRCCVGFPGC